MDRNSLPFLVRFVKRIDKKLREMTASLHMGIFAQKNGAYRKRGKPRGQRFKGGYGLGRLLLLLQEESRYCDRERIPITKPMLSLTAKRFRDDGNPGNGG